jgi:hypothetical protein
MLKVVVVFRVEIQNDHGKLSESGSASSWSCEDSE